ncbi:autotransporter outer membrane beta-barrel domain-containing protein [Serratia sp. UGAL515B_01]|uniref:autotransporter family protein n=1 Tax=Serratia sp. UGAL515B_01 TaxID=2986763 RepID=UPI002952DD17|nr:autotransporter outer membrane beta-barrel domain-containing protein [Serratia sp. UGAL515B_01]WON76142.1 autotransporter outer membrane beta-barrel domain-containing protein [Serratia sp. UGAL515B_01]
MPCYAYRLLLLASVFTLCCMPSIQVQARCINTTTGGQATDGIDMPTSGQSVVCDPTAPNPSTTTITAPTGTTGVNITLLPGSILNTTPRAVGLNGSDSNITNQGTINTAGINAFGMASTGAGNTLTNEGAIRTSGMNSHGISATGSNSLLNNTGTILANGDGANGFRSLETTTATTLVNSGSITANNNGVLLQAGTFENLAGGSVTSARTYGILGGNGGIILRNSGTISAGNGIAIELGSGNNLIEWNAGQIVGTIIGGTGNDTLILRDLADTELVSTPLIDEGQGVGQLIFDNSNITGFSRFTNWDNVILTHHAELTLDSSGMTLGDAVTKTGTLALDSTSSLKLSDDATTSIRSFYSGQQVSVGNAGIIDLGSGILNTTRTLSIIGNYVGEGGELHLNTVLDADDSPSNRLVIAGNGASATGTTSLIITNINGSGATTTDNGILVIDAIEGATTSPGAFKLGNHVVAGPYEYLLFRSSMDNSNPDAWYLRSTLTCAQAPYAPDCKGTVPDYRDVTSLYTVLPAMTILYDRVLTDRLHDRLAEERMGIKKPISRGNGSDAVPSIGWAHLTTITGARAGSPYGIFGNGPKYDYDIVAFQGGFDLYDRKNDHGSQDRAGIHIAIGRISADVTHVDGLNAGKDNINAYTFGGYATHVGVSGWYLNTIAHYTWNDVESQSYQDKSLDTHSNTFSASLEGGQQFLLTNQLSIDPYARLSYRTISFADSNDGVSSISFKNTDSLTSQFGTRIAQNWVLDTNNASPRLLTLWLRTGMGYEFRGEPTTVFSSATGPVSFQADVDGSWGELATGFNAQLDRHISLYGNISYQADFDNSHSNAYSSLVGIRVIW